MAKPVRLDKLFEKLETHLNLNWLYEERLEQQAAEELAEHDKPALELPQEMAAELHKLTLSGDIGGIREQIARLEQMDEMYQPLASRLSQMAKQYQVRKIQKLLESYTSHS